MKHGRLFYLALLALICLAACTNSSDTSTPGPNGPYVSAVRLSGNGTNLIILNVGAVVQGNVDISGLDVNIKCAQNLTFGDVSTVRVGLLQYGCAKIINAAASTPAERQAEAIARKDGRGMWSPSLGAKIARIWAATLGWFERNWQAVLGVLSFLVGILGLVWVANFINKLWNRRYERLVRIVICGAIGAGKTALWLELQKKFTGKDLPPTVKSASAPLPPVPFGRYTLLPAVTDTPGSAPWELARQLKSAHDGVNARSRRMKRILIIVASPYPKVGTGAEGGPDTDYIAEQKGYVNLPVSVIAGDDNGARPHMVIMFISKFDRVSNAGADDTSSANARSLVEDKFKEHKSRVKAVCGTKRIPFIFLIGSATEKWGISELEGKIREVVNG